LTDCNYVFIDFSLYRIMWQNVNTCHITNYKIFCENNILNFKIIFNNKNHSNSISPHTLDPKVTKSFSRNPLITWFPSTLKSCLIFPNYLTFYFVEFYWSNCSIFNNFCTIGLNIIKQPWCTLLIKGFPMVPKEHGKGHSNLGNFNVTNKQIQIDYLPYR